MKKIILLLMGVLTTCTWSFAQDNENPPQNPDCNFVYQDIGYHITDSVKRTVEIVYLQEPLIMSAPMQDNSSLKTRKVNFNNRDVTIPEEVEDKGVKYTVTGIAEKGFTSPSYDHINVLNLPSTLRNIGSGAFMCNESINKIVFTSKEAVRMEGGWLIWNAGVRELELSDAFEVLGGKTFGLNNCVKRVKIGAGLRNIGNNCFADLRRLEKLELSPNNPYLSLYKGVLFNHDKTKLLAAPIALTGTFEIPQGTAEVDSSACYACNFSNITFPSSLRKIGPGAFYLCNNIKIVLPEGLDHIGEEAFSHAKAEEMILPSTIKHVGSKAFSFCNSLKTVSCRSVVPLIVADDTFWMTDIENCVLYVPVGCVEAYRNAEVWKQFKHIEEEASGIGDIDADAVQSVKYVNMAGMESDKPFAGLNIVVVTHADGSRHVAKQQF